MKKSIIAIIIIITCSMISVPIFGQKTLAKKAKADEKAFKKSYKAYVKAVSFVNNGAELIHSKDLDSLVFNLGKVEKRTTTQDTSIPMLAKLELRKFQNVTARLLKRVSGQWDSVHTKYPDIPTELIQPIRISGRYSTVPRVRSILNRQIKIGSISKNYGEAFALANDIGKGLFYFAKGGNMDYQFDNPIWDELSYFEPGYTKATLGKMIDKYVDEMEGFENAKVIETLPDGRKVYDLETCKELWYRKASFWITRTLKKAVDQDLAERQAKN